MVMMCGGVCYYRPGFFSFWWYIRLDVGVKGAKACESLLDRSEVMRMKRMDQPEKKSEHTHREGD